MVLAQTYLKPLGGGRAPPKPARGAYNPIQSNLYLYQVIKTHINY